MSIVEPAKLQRTHHCERVPARVINLRSEATRRTRILGDLEAAGGFRVSLVEAVDGKLLPDDDLLRNTSVQEILNRSGRRMTRGEIGCSLSHRAAYHDLLDSSDPWTLVLEDDAKLDTDAAAVLAAADPWLTDTHPRLLLLTPLRGFLRKSGVPLTNRVQRVQVTRAWDGAGYALNRAAAAVLAELNTPVSLMADDWIAYRGRSNLELAGVDPFVVWQGASIRSTMEAERIVSRTSKQRTLMYRLQRLQQNVRRVVLERLWWRPFWGHDTHRSRD
ncbi:glycosyltransferase family 25 protein [Congregibacter litoralis]|uniref:Glycosyltransferase involved in LPS biosynthesis n=1 Tax=Congregibacter litoralis KT71 TaxID=314285 RepID=V7HUW8_9GAMM|nr:Glycosyltransferase involved in LPS biosynthesis [Congregibacter litoralis KT71]